MKVSERGYTLVELVVVIAIAGVLTMAALQGIGNPSELARFGTQVEEIKGVIHQVQNEATAGKADGLAPGQSLFADRLTFQESSYTLERTADSRNWIPVATINLPSGISLSPAGTQLVFTAPNERYPSVATYSASLSDPSTYDPSNQSQRQEVVLTLSSLRHRATITIDAFGGRVSSRIIQ